MNPYYTDYSEYIGRFFPGVKIQKLSINTGRGCPNRDGSLGIGGCIYCDNRSFTPSYCFGGESVAEQLEKGKQFFARKYKDMQYLAYFQSFSSTYNSSPGVLSRDLEEAMGVKDIVGIVVGTRPDCVDDTVMDTLVNCSRRMPVFVELGVESLYDETLSLINRGHTAATSETAIRQLADAGINVGVHLIAGLPAESPSMTLNTIRKVCEMPVGSIKLHQLQVLKGTALARMIEEDGLDVEPFTMEGYLEFCMEVVKIVPRHIAIERFLASAPPELVIAPKWGVKNYVFTDKLNSLLRNSVLSNKKV